uniref:D-aspartate oxidase n=1 Tax=Magallana gigas TaxID=29159 RepID=K1QI60_MAGGI
MARICVLGAGVAGLSSAVNIQSILPEADVAIIADQFNTETTSDGAAGNFGILLGRTNADICRLRCWTRDSFEWYHKICTSEDANIAGIHRTHGYQLWRTEQPPPFHGSFDYGYRILSKSELLKLPGNYKYGWELNTLMVECRRYLPWLMKRFKEKGGRVIRKQLKNIVEVGSYDVLVNCTGLGSRKLFDDKELVPIRGHTIRVKAPWIKTLFIADSDTYIYPGQDNVVLGGTRQRGEEKLDKDQRYYDDIMARCCRLVPSLKHAEVEKTWVGLRPWRPCVRLEVEMISVDDGRLPVVHNYGHGSDGVCISWECGVDAANLVKQQLTETGSQRLVSKL